MSTWGLGVRQSVKQNQAQTNHRWSAGAGKYLDHGTELDQDFWLVLSPEDKMLGLQGEQCCAYWKLQ